MRTVTDTMIDQHIAMQLERKKNVVVTSFTTSFADGRYRFFLNLPQLYEFEDKHGSIAGLEYRLSQSIGLDEHGKPVFTGGGEAQVKAIRDVIRCALIGGAEAEIDGEKVEIGPQRAKDLVDRYIYPVRPVGEAAALAWRILAAAMYGEAPEAHSSAANPSDQDEPPADQEGAPDV